MINIPFLALLSLALVLPAKTQVSEVGLIPVDAMEIMELTPLSGEKTEGDFGQKPDQHHNQRTGSSDEKKAIGKIEAALAALPAESK